MDSVCLIGTKEIKDCNNDKMKLEYYLTVIKSDFDEIDAIYGIQLVKCKRTGKRIEKEMETIKRLSYSKKLVEQIIVCLMDNTVTPICMLEIVDEYISKEMMFA